MLRTLVSPQENEYKLAHKKAAALGISVAEYFRWVILRRLSVPTSFQRNRTLPTRIYCRLV